MKLKVHFEPEKMTSLETKLPIFSGLVQNWLIAEGFSRQDLLAHALKEI
jgi:hypothetical protein